MAHLVYFSWVREKIGTPEERVSLPATVQNVADLLAFLRGRGEPYASLLADPHLRVAVNQSYAQPESAVTDADEIALFPPVSGG
ncbi:MAG: molybdopterin converting factor subunit 1 [Magnetococcales bacterium]|nr:molybdopterin converting factor subunit 1 [Magnetococcales bacterium]